MQSAAEIEIAENVWPCQTDLLKRHEEIELLTPMLLGMPSPAVMALDAPWGQGKTTFIRLWQEYLRQQGLQYVSFNAWESDFADDPLLPLLAAFDEWLKDNAALTGNEQDWSQLKALAGKVMKAGIVAGLKLATMGALDATDVVERVAADGVGDATGTVVDAFLGQQSVLKNFRDLLEKVVAVLPATQPNLLIFIDELDRCRPTYAIELLERIKHLFNIPRVVFVLGMDSGQLSESIKAVYGNGFDARLYLRRFIDFDYVMKEPVLKNFVMACLITPEFNAYFSARRNGSYDREHIASALGILGPMFNLDLRSVRQLIFRLGLVIAGTPAGHKFDGPLIATLLLLRSVNYLLYLQYINNVASHAEEVIAFLKEKISPALGYSHEMALIEAYLLCGSDRELEENLFQSLLEPYKTIVTAAIGDANPDRKHHAERVIEIANHLRRYSDGSAGPAHVFRKIELLNSVRS